MDEIDQTVVDALDTFLRIPHQKEETQQQQEQEQEHQQQYRHHRQHQHQQQQQQQQQPFKEISTSSSFNSSQLSLLSQLSHEESKTDDSYREIILHNCEGKERLEQLVVLLMKTNSSLTIRYDKQRKLPTHIARGMLRGAEYEHDSFCRLRSLTLKGMTITPLAANFLQMTLPLLPNLEKLTIRGNITLVELDSKGSSIAGPDHSKMVHVVEALHRTLRNLPQLQHLDLQQCHLPDEFLADILEALYPESIRSLNLNGNMAHRESQHILYQILSHRRCRLEHLDMSWQRLPNARRNCSVLDFGVLSSVLANKNTSLKTLNLSENRLLDEDVAHLATALSQHPYLCKVRLQDCRIGDQGMLALARELPKWPEHLKHLHLDGNQKIRNKSMVRNTIFRSLLRNVFLKELALPYEIQSKSTDWALELNRAGRRALLEPPSERDCHDPAIECTITSAPSFDSQNGTNHICDALWPSVLERADHIARRESNREESSTTKAASALYLLLREKGYHAILQ